MSRVLYDILENIDEGIIILNENLEIYLWNNYMERITCIGKGEVIDKNIYDVLPNLNTSYFSKLINSVTSNGCKMFLSAAMHDGIINNKGKFNLEISKLENDENIFLLLEFTDVTNQFVRINQLKDCIDKLYVLNKKLKDKEKTIKRLAYYDRLTGVANRTLFYKFFDKFLSSAKRNENLLGLMFIDVDKFKSINDTYGHKKGDDIIIEVSKVLTKSIRKNDLVARYGGDEFLILVPCLKNLKDIKSIILRIIDKKNKILNLQNNLMDVYLSIGISVYPYDGNNIDEIITKADKAMYIAKKKSGDNWRFYNNKIYT